MTQNCLKLEKYLFPGISGCILAPATGGPSESSCSEGSEYVWQRGVGSQKCLVRAAFDQSSSYSGGLIESCPKPGTFDPLPPFAIHILNPLDMRIHRDPPYLGQKCTQKCLETNTSQLLGNCRSITPPPHHHFQKLCRSTFLTFPSQTIGEKADREFCRHISPLRYAPLYVYLLGTFFVTKHPSKSFDPWEVKKQVCHKPLRQSAFIFGT